jgi:type IV fimbrial biogenesis protein FimT
MAHRVNHLRIVRATGFTIVEAMVVVAVLAILLGVGAPSMTRMGVNQRLKAAGHDIASSMSAARSEALTRNVDVTVAPIGGSWTNGWTITEAGGTVIRRQDAYTRITLTGPANVVFNGDGRPNSTATPFAATSAETDTNTYRCVRLRPTGRPVLSAGSC